MEKHRISRVHTQYANITTPYCQQAHDHDWNNATYGSLTVLQILRSPPFFLTTKALLVRMTCQTKADDILIDGPWLTLKSAADNLCIRDDVSRESRYALHGISTGARDNVRTCAMVFAYWTCDAVHESAACVQEPLSVYVVSARVPFICMKIASLWYSGEQSQGDLQRIISSLVNCIPVW